MVCTKIEIPKKSSLLLSVFSRILVHYLLSFNHSYDHLLVYYLNHYSLIFLFISSLFFLTTLSLLLLYNKSYRSFLVEREFYCKRVSRLHSLVLVRLLSVLRKVYQVYCVESSGFPEISHEKHSSFSCLSTISLITLESICKYFYYGETPL